MATPAWDPTKLYGIGERVADAGREWISVKSNRAIKPSSRPGTWSIAPPLPPPQAQLVIPRTNKIAAFNAAGGFRNAVPTDFPAFGGTASDIVALFGALNHDSSHCLAADGTIQPIGAGGGITSVNGDVGPVVVLTAGDISGFAAIATSGSASDLIAGTVPIARIPLGTSSSTVCVGNDSRLSDSRTPSAHATSHASAGSDPVTLAQSQITGLVAGLALKAPLVSPTFTGTPAGPTAGAGTNTTQLATTAFVTAAVSAGTAGALLIANNLSDLGNVVAARSNLGLSAVAASGAYSDLSGTPTIPTITGSLVLKGSGGNAVAASAADVISLWTGTPGGMFLRDDGFLAAVSTVAATPGNLKGDGAGNAVGWDSQQVADIDETATTDHTEWTSITATRLALLNSAGARPVGSPIWINDASGSVSPTVKIRITPALGETINGSATPYDITSPFGGAMLWSDGASNWTAVRLFSTVTASIVSGLAAIASSGSASDLVAGTVPIARIPTGSTGTTVPFGNDARFSDARTPTAHAASHAAAGSDPVTLTEAQITNLVSDLALKAPLASPTFTGTPAAPNPTAGTNTTQIATTHWVLGEVASATGTALQIAANLGDLNNVGTARSNLVLATGANLIALFTGTPTGSKFARDDGTIAQVAYSQVTGTPSLAAIATSGSASDLSSGTIPLARHGSIANNAILSGPVSGGPATASFRLAQLADIQAWLGTKTANFIFAGPGSGAAALPDFRALVLADIPTIIPATTDVLKGGGTINTAAALGSQAANFVLSSPDGSAGVMTPRALVAADLPPGSGGGTFSTVNGVMNITNAAYYTISGTVPASYTILALVIATTGPASIIYRTDSGITSTNAIHLRTNPSFAFEQGAFDTGSKLVTGSPLVNGRPAILAATGTNGSFIGINSNGYVPSNTAFGTLFTPTDRWAIGRGITTGTVYVPWTGALICWIALYPSILNAATIAAARNGGPPAGSNWILDFRTLAAVFTTSVGASLTTVGSGFQFATV